MILFGLPAPLIMKYRNKEKLPISVGIFRFFGSFNFNRNFLGRGSQFRVSRFGIIVSSLVKELVLIV